LSETDYSARAGHERFGRAHVSLKGQVGIMERKDIIRVVMEKEYQISPEAVEFIYSSNFPKTCLDMSF